MRGVHLLVGGGWWCCGWYEGGLYSVWVCAVVLLVRVYVCRLEPVDVRVDAHVHALRLYAPHLQPARDPW